MRAPKVVVVSPARDRPLEEHLRLGEAIAALPGRVALIASADHGHAHTPDGIYGYHPAAARYDALLQEIVASDRLDFFPLADARRVRQGGLALAARRPPGRGGRVGARGRARVRRADVLRDARRGGSDGGVEPPLARHALELVDAAVLELEPRACDEILDRARDEHLARPGDGRRPARRCGRRSP